MREHRAMPVVEKTQGHKKHIADCIPHRAIFSCDALGCEVAQMQVVGLAVAGGVLKLSHTGICRNEVLEVFGPKLPLVFRHRAREKIALPALIL